MIIAPLPLNENERIADLYNYNILDSLPEKEYNDIVEIAAEICNMPMSVISLVDKDRQWFKAKKGLEDDEASRDVAFCAHAILHPDELMEIENSHADIRFLDNPMVTGAPYVGFYAGVPLLSDKGSAIGTLCVLDTKPNRLTDAQSSSLKALARQIMVLLDIRKKNKELDEQKAELMALNAELSQFAQVVAHDIKSPCGNLAMASNLLYEMYKDKLDREGLSIIALMEQSSLSITKMIDGILQHTHIINKAAIKKEDFTFTHFITELKNVISLPPDFEFICSCDQEEIHTSRYMLLQILLNLCNNALKYNDKPQGKIDVTMKTEPDKYIFSVTDNGIGIREEDHKRVFGLFTTLGVPDRYNNFGHGIGLNTVKKLVEKLDGTIAVQSTPGNGSTFSVTITR
jgi:hypothetical protein